ncbi:MAG TPA: carbonic anhydrase family protein [Telluria sp.]|nr:carbonic anhydrase family protein [Telluria sp.]
MRIKIAVFACCFAMANADANDPPHSAPAEAAKPASAAASASVPSIKPNILPPKPSPASASAAASASKSATSSGLGLKEESEDELNARIAKRIADMRAAQIERANQQARARKAAEAKKREEARKAAAPPPPAHGTHWEYEGELGPANWSKINVDWAACGTGRRQSPIDIRDGMKVDLENITFDYKPSSFTVVDNGHTVQVNVASGNYITVGNRSYELQQFHFHRPSEERVNGKGYEMVVHLVHKDAEGKLAVVAVLLERGRALAPIQTVWNNLPLEKNDVVSPTVVLDLNELLPKGRDYYTYMGSLTTPPCTEGVLWLVMKQPKQAAPAQLALFARLYPLNARPIQQAAGRVIKESSPSP